MTFAIRMLAKILCCFLFLFLFFSCDCFSQAASPATLSADSIQNWYMGEVKGANLLYNGALYEGSYARVAGNAYWRTDSFQNGWISYRGIIYKNVPLMYDLVRNETLTKSFQQYPIRLENSRVDSFGIGGATFLGIHNDTTAGNPLRDNLYQLIFREQGLYVYAAQSKRIITPMHAENADTIVSSVNYYLSYNYKNYNINSANDFVRVFPKEKEALKHFWKQHHLVFKKEPETFIQQTLSFWLASKK